MSTTIDDAWLTPFARGRLRTDDGPERWIRGAVYLADGTLLTASQRDWSGDHDDPVAADPAHARPPRPRLGGLLGGGPPELRGTWCYGGHWSTHFGHFLLETLPALWPLLDATAPAGTTPLPIVAHRGPRGRRDSTPDGPADLHPWQRDLLTLLGAQPRVHLVADVGVRVDRLVVGTRPVVLRRRVSAEAVAVWQHVARALGPADSPERLYLSRTAFHASSPARSRAAGAWDAHLDATFAAAGFTVVAPETLPIREQIRLVRDARLIAGPSGSGLHLTAFARPGAQVLTVGDARVPRRPTHNQRLLDAAVGHHPHVVAHQDHAGLERVLGDLIG